MSLLIETSCPTCDQKESDVRNFAIGYITNEDVIAMKCNNGHEFNMVTTAPKFANMYENGLTAFNNDNMFEAFSCFYSSYELFKISFIKAYLFIIEGKTLEETDSFLKNLKFSERISGAFSLIYFSFFNEILKPKTTKNKSTELRSEDITLRNNIVHSGTIPTKKEIEELGYNIYRFIRINYQLFSNSTDEFPFPVIMQYDFKKMQHLKEKYPTYHVDNHDGTSLELTSQLDLKNLPTFEELLEKNKRNEINKSGAKFFVDNEFADKDIRSLRDELEERQSKDK